MAIKGLTTKILFYLVIIFIYLISCTSKKSILSKKIVKEEIKIAFFKKCIKLGFNNSNEINVVLSKDFSKPLSDFSLKNKNYLAIENYAKKINLNMKKDSALFSENRAEGNGNEVFRSCLDGYNSKTLDSLVNVIYFDLKKNHN